MDFCGSTCPTMTARMLLDQHGNLAGCNFDSNFLSAAEHDLLLAIASQVLNRNSDIVGEDEVRAAA